MPDMTKEAADIGGSRRRRHLVEAPDDRPQPYAHVRPVVAVAERDVEPVEERLCRSMIVVARRM
jgi:hypothetical protein